MLKYWIHNAFLTLVVCLLCVIAPTLTHADSFPRTAPSHGLARYDDLALDADFPHFPYVNPNAPKGGSITLGALGTFDTLNPFTLKGLSAAGVGMTFATLLEPSLDEPSSAYGFVADKVTVSADKTKVRFHLRSTAHFDDGMPITAQDVIFSFTVLRDKGHPLYRSYLRDVAEVIAPDSQTVVFRLAHAKNPDLLSVVGQLPILPRHVLEKNTHDFSTTTLDVWPSSGAYRISDVQQGRSITYTRVKDWWGRDLPIARGRFNFDTIRYDYYRDTGVALEAFLAGRLDWKLENVARDWAVAYDTPAVRDGRIRREVVPNDVPAGMQAFVMNLRRPLFQDRRVREALGLAFDFEWANAHVAWGAYTRTASYFANSDLAAVGLPSAEERALLEPYRAQLPEEVFKAVYQPPKTDGSGRNRENLRRAMALLKEAGWSLKDGVLRNAKGEAFSFELINPEPVFERWIQPFRRNLDRLGIAMRYRIVDSAQYQQLLDTLSFDMIINVFPAPLIPSLEQREYWGSAHVDEQGTRNLAGVRNVVVDALIERILAAETRSELVIATRALDRVLLWNYYVIPQWHIGSNRIAWWDTLARPERTPRYGLGAPDTWWKKRTS